MKANEIKSNRSLLELEQYSGSKNIFNIGDTVRSYNCGFNNEKPFKHHFLQGVVIDLETWINPNDYLKVKWQIENYFGKIYDYKMPHNGSDTFVISVSSPWLVKVNKFQLALPL